MSLNSENAKNIKIYECEICNFKCIKSSDFNRHLITDKHKNLTNPNFILQKNCKTEFQCICGKVYKHASTLSCHKKTCNGNISNDEKINNNNDEKINNNDEKIINNNNSIF